jgi:hypothetical protein
MRTARQISAQLKKAKKVALKESVQAQITAKRIAENSTFGITKLVAPNQKIADKLALAEANQKAKKNVIDTTVIIKPVDDVICTNGLHIPKDCMYIPGFFKEDKEDGYYIINANGYTEEQLSTELPREDIDYIEAGIKIPLNFGVGVELIHKGERLIYARGGQSWRAKPTVTLEIYTWRGISCGALHYYGKLNICFPEATYNGNKEKENYTTSTYIPMYKRHEIELTQVLEEWEIKKYPKNYRNNEAGQRHRGFYTKKQVTEYAELVFEQIFAEGWIFRIDDHS